MSYNRVPGWYLLRNDPSSGEVRSVRKLCVLGLCMSVCVYKQGHPGAWLVPDTQRPKIRGGESRPYTQTVSDALPAGCACTVLVVDAKAVVYAHMPLNPNRHATPTQPTTHADTQLHLPQERQQLRHSYCAADPVLHIP